MLSDDSEYEGEEFEHVMFLVKIENLEEYDLDIIMGEDNFK